MKVMKATFKSICRMSQYILKQYVYEQLKETHENVFYKDGFVYAEGKLPMLLVAHMDTVHKKLPKKIIWKNGAFSSPNGIGGDDRCGIFMILEIIKQYNCSVLFCEDEEIGGVGAEKFIGTKLADGLVGKFNYIIEFDRKGKDDAVYYNCDNPDFENFISADGFYSTSYGSFSDISTVAPFLKAAAVNLSCGYYKAHTNEEYVVWNEMINSMEAAKMILARTTMEDKFEYIEGKYSSNWYNYYGYGYGYDDYYGYGAGNFVVEYLDHKGEEFWHIVKADNEIEAVGAFCMEFWEIPYGNIIDIYPTDDCIWQ